VVPGSSRLGRSPPRWNELCLHLGERVFGAALGPGVNFTGARIVARSQELLRGGLPKCDSAARARHGWLQGPSSTRRLQMLWG